ncbi:MAG: hypothetical protein K0R15_2565 [Clostridiales bacterium]|nr:hypothetical protein [Clostridiales bacterium]
MLAYVSEKISSKWSEKGIIDNEEIDVYRYGIEIVLSSLFGIVSVLTIGLIFGAMVQAIIFLVIFIPLRMYTGGYHANTYIRCNTTTIVLFATQVLLVNLARFTVPIYFIGYLIGAIIIVGAAPIKNDNKKIETQHKRRYKLIASIIYAVDIH